MGKKPNMRDVAGEDHKPEPRGNPGVVTPASDKDIDIIKGDKSESGSNSYAKTIQAAVKALAQGGSVAGGVAGSVAKKIAKD
jgi:hypothetical protein